MLSVKQTHETPPAGMESSSLVKQLVDIEILYLLTFTPKSGYELRKQLLNWFKINVSYGTLYPHLHSLEKTGFITGAWQPKFDAAPLRKRIYSLTPSGIEVLRGSVESLTKITLTMQFMMTRVNMGLQLPLASGDRSALELVEGFFLEHGYVVKKSGVIRGFSGVEYPVDLFANAPGSKSSNVIVRIVERNGITIDDILKTHVMSFDLEASSSIILTASDVSEEISKLAAFYHISIYGGKNLESAASNMCSTYKL
ncbi:MAG: PadR family transcriptional regulator [Nitrososphaerales archaeon]